MMSNETMELESHLRALKLPSMLAEYPAVARQCTENQTSYEEFLLRLAAIERERRQSRATDRRLQKAGFPVPKELSEFDFAAVPKLNKQKVLELGRGEFIEKRENVVAQGPAGTGKTHLAIALGREAFRQGYKVAFYTAAKLVNTYLEAREQRTVLKLEESIRRCDLIVVDELGYIPFDRSGAEYLFSFFSECYEQTSLIVTTNLPFAEWPQVLAEDERLAGALIDRLTHRAHVLEVPGDSYRLQQNLKSRERRSSSGQRRKGGDTG